MEKKLYFFALVLLISCSIQPEGNNNNKRSVEISGKISVKNNGAYQTQGFKLCVYDTTLIKSLDVDSNGEYKFQIEDADKNKTYTIIAYTEDKFFVGGNIVSISDNKDYKCDIEVFFYNLVFDSKNYKIISERENDFICYIMRDGEIIKSANSFYKGDVLCVYYSYNGEQIPLQTYEIE